MSRTCHTVKPDLQEPIKTRPLISVLVADWKSFVFLRSLQFVCCCCCCCFIFFAKTRLSVQYYHKQKHLSVCANITNLTLTKIKPRLFLIRLLTETINRRESERNRNIQKMPHNEARYSRTDQDSNPHLSIRGRLEKRACLPVRHASLLYRLLLCPPCLLYAVTYSPLTSSVCDVLDRV